MLLKKNPYLLEISSEVFMGKNDVIASICFKLYQEKNKKKGIHKRLEKSM